MRPPVERELKTSWAVFAAAVVLCGGFLAWWWDWGATAEAEHRAALAYQQRRAELDLARQLQLQQQHNVALDRHIEDLKQQTGVREVQPFIAPGAMRGGQYFQALLFKIRQDLEATARRRGVGGYDPSLGFEFLQGRIPRPELVDQWLLMLQLTSKAAYLALNSPRNSLQVIEIRDLGSGFQPHERGPRGRPPLLDEYRFELEVHGSLRDILWLHHQLVAEEPTAAHREMQKWLNGEDGVTSQVYQSQSELRDVAPPEVDHEAAEVSPLVLLDLTIESPTRLSDEETQPLKAEFTLAGMDFLPRAERGQAAPVVTADAGGPKRRIGVASP